MREELPKDASAIQAHDAVCPAKAWCKLQQTIQRSLTIESSYKPRASVVKCEPASVM